MSWYNIGTLKDLVINSGVCAKINNQQVAVFHIPDEQQSVFAISNFDPIGKANVLAR
ncbi:MAG: nitrite reductase (NAD(P)H) small subunit, partial [Pseudoalteromonas sp.]